MESEGGAAHLIFGDTSPLKVFMQTRAFVDKLSLLSTSVLSMVYAVLGANLVSFVNELFTNVDRRKSNEESKINAHRHVSTRL